MIIARQDAAFPFRRNIQNITNFYVCVCEIVLSDINASEGYWQLKHEKNAREKYIVDW